MSKTVALLLTHDFNEQHYAEPVEAFRRAGHSVINVAHHAGDVVYGEQAKLNVTVDCAIDSIQPHHIDALFIPGGLSPLYCARKALLSNWFARLHYQVNPFLVCVTAYNCWSLRAW